MSRDDQPATPDADEPRPSQLQERLTAFADSLARRALDELDRPHVVIVRDLETGTSFVAGPYADAMAAACAAEAGRDKGLGARQRRPQAYEVKLLLSPDRWRR